MLCPNLDSADNAWIRTQLEHIRSEVYETEYPELKARTLVPIDNDPPPGTERITREFYDTYGAAELTSAYNTTPALVGIAGGKTTTDVAGFAVKYQYHFQEVRGAREAGRDLPAAKAKAARETVERGIDKVLLVGDAAVGLNGLFNHPNGMVYTVPAGAAGSTKWTGAAGKTPLEVYADLAGVVAKQISDSLEVERPDTIVLSTAEFMHIKQTPMAANNPKTILNYFRENHEEITLITSHPRLNTLGAGGVTRGIAYARRPDRLVGAIPQEVEQLPTVWNENGFHVTLVHARTGGTIADRPKSIISFEDY